ncbi:MAG: helix-hairpin-helix domain-containing protein [Bacillota bacterium]
MFKINTKNILILVIILLLLFLSYYNQEKQNEEILNAGSNLNSLESEKLEHKSAEDNIIEIIVHLSGGVKNPGVYKLNKNDRLINLIEAAGGLKKQADLEQINLAEKLYDGQKVIIPLIIEKNIEVNSSVQSGLQDSTEILNNYSSSSNNQLININQADQAELETLSGIGPSKAAAIIKYREQNSFFMEKKDLLNVSGIGEKTLENIEDEIIIK